MNIKDALNAAPPGQVADLLRRIQFGTLADRALTLAQSGVEKTTIAITDHAIDLAGKPAAILAVVDHADPTRHYNVLPYGTGTAAAPTTGSGLLETLDGTAHAGVLISGTTHKATLPYAPAAVVSVVGVANGKYYKIQAIGNASKGAEGVDGVCIYDPAAHTLEFAADDTETGVAVLAVAPAAVPGVAVLSSDMASLTFAAGDTVASVDVYAEIPGDLTADDAAALAALDLGDEFPA